jgi:O-antigen/teichoic acid export membrane protein
VLVFLAIAAFGQVLSTHAPFGFYQAMHLVKFPAKVLTVEAALNLALSIWLAPRMGITGVALATAMPAIFISTIVLPLYLSRHLGLNMRTLLGVSVIPGALMFAVNAAVLYFSEFVITNNSYPALAVRALISVPVAMIVFFATFPPADRRAILKFLSIMRTVAPGLA